MLAKRFYRPAPFPSSPIRLHLPLLERNVSRLLRMPKKIVIVGGHGKVSRPTIDIHDPA